MPHPRRLAIALTLLGWVGSPGRLPAQGSPAKPAVPRYHQQDVLGANVPFVLPVLPVSAPPMRANRGAIRGAIIGGAILGGTTAALLVGLCADSDTDEGCVGPAVGGFLVGATVGAVLGAFIGDALSSDGTSQSVEVRWGGPAGRRGRDWAVATVRLR
jgi:hypothetical protein